MLHFKKKKENNWWVTDKQTNQKQEMQPLVRARVDMNHNNNNNNFKAQRNKISTLSGAVVQYVFVVNTHGIHVTIPWTLSFAALLQF